MNHQRHSFICSYHASQAASTSSHKLLCLHTRMLTVTRITLNHAHHYIRTVNILCTSSRMIGSSMSVLPCRMRHRMLDIINLLPSTSPNHLISSATPGSWPWARVGLVMRGLTAALAALLLRSLFVAILWRWYCSCLPQETKTKAFCAQLPTHSCAQLQQMVHLGANA